MKHQITCSLLLALLLCVVGSGAYAHDIEVANADGKTIYYVYNDGSDGTTVSVSYRGSSYSSYSNEYSGDIVIPESVSYNAKTYSVTGIGYAAFDGCSGLTSVTIPNSVTSIGSSAFGGCSGLTSVIIPNSVTSIGSSAFSSCSGLTSVTISNNVTSIGKYAFAYCRGLSSVTIPNSVTSIGSLSFVECTSLTSVTIPNSVTSIDNGAFRDCDGLTAVHISDLSAWCKISFDNAFYQPYHLYLNEEEIKELVIPNDVTSINDDTFSRCCGLTTVTIGNNVTSIGSCAFEGCSSLTSVTIGNNVTSIGSSAFSDCRSLTSVTIGNSVTTIGSSAFYNCEELTFVAIGSSVTAIEDYTFHYCGKIKYVFIERTEPITITDRTFYLRSGSILCVPVGSKAAYENADYWKDFKMIIEAGFPGASPSIAFADDNVKALCIANWDFNADGELSEAEAAIVPDLEDVFCRNKDIVSFKELEYFNMLTSIGRSAFEDCSGLTSVTIPNSVTVIDDYAFEDCSGLTSLTISNNVTSIGSYAFNGCSAIEELVFPTTLTSIGSSAFSGCTGLKKVISLIPDPTGISCPFNSPVNENVLLIIPKGTKALYRNAWGYVSSIFEEGEPIAEKEYTDEQGIKYERKQDYYTKEYSYEIIGHTEDLASEIVIPEKIANVPIVRINSDAFKDCTGLTMMTLPNNLTSIGSDAFKNCTGLTKVTLPNSLTDIGYSQFDGCTGITEVISLIENPSAVSGSFASIIYNNAVLQVPVGTKSAYMDTWWKDFLMYEAGSTPLTHSFTDSQGVMYTVKKDSYNNYYYSITGYTEAIAERVTVPTELNGMPVTKIDNEAFKNCTAMKWIFIPETITERGSNAFDGCMFTLALNQNTVSGWNSLDFIEGVEFGDDVETIENDAFRYCTNLKHLKIGKGVTSIPLRSRYSWSSPFDGCSALESIIVAVENTIYDSRDNCNAIIETANNRLLYGSGSTVIPETVTAIAELAFQSCTSLTEITIPAGVTEIGSDAFSGCTGLQTVTSYLDTPIDNPGFGDDVMSSATLRVPYLKSNVYRNNDYWNFTNIVEMDGSPEEMTIINFADPVAKSICVNNWDINGDSEISMGEAKLVTSISGFSGNTELVSFDELQYFTNVTSINNYAFSGCSGLTSLTIPASVTSIGESAFKDCSGLTSVSIPNGVTSIGERAFYGCSGLTSVSIPNSVTSIGGSAFSGCSNMASIVLPNGLTTIDSETFYNCSNLATINIPNSVTSIGSGAFRDCSKLTSITLLEGLTTIGSEAFKGSGLLSINIPSTVTSIGEYALAGDVIYCNLTAPIDIGYIISQPSEVILYVPKGCEEAFRNANYWKDFIVVSSSDQNTDWSEGEIVVDVEDAGELRLAIIERDEESISRLKIRGPLNSTDIKYLMEGTGKLADLESLDLSEVTLAYDDECYLTITKEDGIYGLGGRRFTYYYFFSENENITVSSDSWGTDFATCYYSPYLAGVFQNKTYKHVVMPNSVTKAAESIFSNCTNLVSVEYPGGISRVGDSAFENCTLLPSVTLNHPNSIGEKAFSGCKLLQNIEGLNEVRSIGASAFSSCKRLNDVSLLNVDSIPSRAFYGCVMLDNFTLSDNLYFIGENAFGGCKRLASVALPESLATLSSYAFKDCSSLSEVTYSPTLMKVDYTSFQNTPFMEALPVEDGIKYMGHIALSYDADSGVANTSPATLAFREGTTCIADNFIGSMYVNYNKYSDNVTTVTFPLTLRKVGDYAFYDNTYNCTFNAKSLTLPEGLEEIGTRAFFKAQQLTKVTIPEGLKIVGNEAFAYCPKLNIVNYNAVMLDSKRLFSSCSNIEKVTIGEKVELLPEGIFSGCSVLAIVKSTARSEVTPFEIGNSAFSGCSVLSKLELPEDVIAIGNSAFSGCSALKSFVCSESLETIGGSAFSGCTGLTAFQMNEGLKTIGDDAFYHCSNITAFQLPESLDSIGSHAFEYCTALTELTIPASVTRLGSGFLYYCDNLTKLTSLIKEPMDINDVTTSTVYNEATLYVPDGTKTLYRNAEGWKRFENIEELSANDVTAHNKLSVSDANIVRGMKTSISVNLMNDILNFQAYQFDLIVPRGITIAENAEGEMDITMGSRYSVGGQPVVVKKLAVNQYSKVDKYRFVFFSPIETITGTDGALLTVTLKASNTITIGNYQATLENILFTQSNGIESALDKVRFTLSVKEPTGGLVGDATGDGNVTITDAVYIVNYLMGNTLDGFNAGGADVNGDGRITITDAVAVVNIILNNGVVPAPKMDMKESEVEPK